MSKSKLVPFLSSIVLFLIPSIANAEVQDNDSSGYVIDGPPAAGQKPDATIPHTYVPYFGQSIEQPKHILDLYPDLVSDSSAGVSRGEVELHNNRGNDDVLKRIGSQK